MLMWSGFARVWEADDEGDGRGDRTTVRHGHRCLLRECDPDLFFPTTSSEERLALKACAQCPAICECARYAAEHALINGYPLQGIWGGINRSKGKNYRNNEKEM